MFFFFKYVKVLGVMICNDGSVIMDKGKGFFFFLKKKKTVKCMNYALFQTWNLL